MRKKQQTLGKFNAYKMEYVHEYTSIDLQTVQGRAQIIDGKITKKPRKIRIFIMKFYAGVNFLLT